MKRLVAVFCMTALSVMLTGGAFGADEAKSAAPTQPPAERMRPMPMDRNVAFIAGSISKIDSTSPENIKVEIVNDMDGKSHVVQLGASTNILKVVDIVDLKAGDKARIVARKDGDKEIALSVVTGKLKEMPRPPAPMAPAPIANKEQTKK